MLKSLFSIKKRSQIGDFLKQGYDENKHTRTFLLNETSHEPKRLYSIENEIFDTLAQSLEQVYSECKTQQGYKILHISNEGSKKLKVELKNLTKSSTQIFIRHKTLLKIDVFLSPKFKFKDILLSTFIKINFELQFFSNNKIK